MKKENKKEFYQFLWRPRPRSVLKPEEIAAIKEELSKYIKMFDEEDRKREEAELAAIRRSKAKELLKWRLTLEKMTATAAAWVRGREQASLEIEEAGVYEVRVETKEELLETKEEIA